MLNTEAAGQHASCSSPVFVARQAIFDNDYQVAAYELLFRACNAGPAHVRDESSATASVIANGLSLVADQLGNRPVFINFPARLLLEDAPFALPPESCVIEILENVTPTPELIKKLKEYKDQGYILALDDYVGQPELEPFLELADIVKVEVLGRSMVELIKLSQKLRSPDRMLLAEKIENRDTFELVKSLGYTRFQGYYFCKPVIVEGVSLQPHAVARLRLLREISTPDYHVKKVARIISQDTSLSYRLLSHLNTPHFAFRGKVNSLAQAVTLMGARPLKQWLLLVMLADTGEGGQHDELVFTSVCRAGFMERLARLRPVPPYDQDTFFLVGLFSNLDALMNQPMSEITPHLPFDEAITAALLGEDNEIGAYLDLRLQLETGNWRRAEQIMRDLDLPAGTVASLHAHAAAWAFKMLDFEGAGAHSSRMGAA